MFVAEAQSMQAHDLNSAAMPANRSVQTPQPLRALGKLTSVASQEPCKSAILYGAFALVGTVGLNLRLRERMHTAVVQDVEPCHAA